MSKNPTLNYSLTKSGPLMVVSLTGELSVETIAELEKLKEELFPEMGVKFIAIDFSNCKDISTEAIPSFVQLQKSLRSQNQRFLMSGFTEEMKTKFYKLGVIRQPEVVDTLKKSLILGTKLIKE